MNTATIPRTRFALVGTGGRSTMYSHALLGTYQDRHDLVAMCDANPGRMAFFNREFAAKFQSAPLPCYAPADFERMLHEHRVQCVIVTTTDRTHHEYIIRAMEAGCDVIVEKPLTIDVEKCRAIHEATRRTGRRLRATFNMRYTPVACRIKELLAQGAVGDVFSVHFEWLLDTSHGADYFRRWHRDMDNSGGLMVHKASHHFDLINWLLDSRPETVFGFGDLRFYGRANAEARGDFHPYVSATGDPAAAGDPYALQLTGRNKEMYHDTAAHDGYRRDQNVFGDGISIPDDMAVIARYRNRATLTYHLTAYSPWEGWRCMINGSKGRLEVVNEAEAFVAGAADPRLDRFGAAVPHQAGAMRHILVRPLWEKPYAVPMPAADGDHGGGDKRMLEDLFVGGGGDPLGRAADHRDGTYAIMMGIAANHSFATGEVVRVDELFAGAF